MTEDEPKSRRPLDEIHDLRKQMIDAVDAYLAYEFDFGQYLGERVDVDTKEQARRLMHYTVIRYYRRIRPHIKKRKELWEEMELWGEKQGLQKLDDWILKRQKTTAVSTDNNLKTKQQVTDEIATPEPEKVIEACDKLLEASDVLGFEAASEEQLPTDMI